MNATEAAKEREERQRIVHAALSTAAGKALLDLLERVYAARPLMGATPERTAYNVGQHDLVADLKSWLSKSNPTGES